MEPNGQMSVMVVEQLVLAVVYQQQVDIPFTLLQVAVPLQLLEMEW
tara:strand:+ start:515 stop:652 length:138 start_codon:yes stop_codon:yes gene_type:complete